jgi:tRNA pseudouridine13 synthase
MRTGGPAPKTATVHRYRNEVVSARPSWFPRRDVPKPFEPPIWTGQLPGVGGQIGPSPEDFSVDEVPLYEASGSGDHLYVRVRKRGRTTKDLVRAVAEAAGVPQPEVGTAGMKDKQAVTTQWVSVPARAARPVDAWALREGFEIVEASRHTNKLRTGHLSGNRFRIRIVDVAGDAAPLARSVLADVTARGLPNYFGAQRFGFGGDNLDRALEWASGRRSRIPPFERKLFASVLQSEVFNRYVVARTNESLDVPLDGEVVRLEGSRALFVVEDAERETPRWRSRDVHPTGPMFGPKMKAPAGKPLDLERAARETLGLDDDALSRVARFADGTRRDLFVHPADLSLEADGPNSLVVSFFLPAGSYATLLVRELTRGTFLTGDPR